MLKKWISRKFLLLTALFVLAQVLKFKGIIGDTAWLVGSTVGVFGFAALNAWMQYRKIYGNEK
jgi:uncharacterized membrane protein